MKFGFTTTAAAIVGAAFMISGAQAADLPKKMTWSAYGTTSSGYAQAVAIGNMLKKRHGTSIRIIPGKNDISRMAPLRDGKIDFCACGAAVYMGQEGAFLFADEAWGPQPLRLAMTAAGSYNLALAVAGDSGIKTLSDLKGKRVVFVKGGDALNWNAEAHMAFGGVSWDDVTKVTVSGFAASFDAIINGQADAGFTSTVSPVTKKLAASPRGIHWPPLPHDDAAGWKRAKSVAPIYYQNVGSVGTNLSKDKPHYGAAYPYPILVSNADKSADVVYALVKSMVENFDDYKKGAKGGTGWALANQKMQWALPYHDGAIKYWKEKGVWTADAQAHNDNLIKRQGVIQAAWKTYKASAKGAPKDAYKAGWLKARAAALKQANMPVVFN